MRPSASLLAASLGANLAAGQTWYNYKACADAITNDVRAAYCSNPGVPCYCAPAHGAHELSDWTIATCAGNFFPIESLKQRICRGPYPRPDSANPQVDPYPYPPPPYGGAGAPQAQAQYQYQPQAQPQAQVLPHAQHMPQAAAAAPGPAQPSSPSHHKPLGHQHSSPMVRLGGVPAPGASSSAAASPSSSAFFHGSSSIATPMSSSRSTPLRSTPLPTSSSSARFVRRNEDAAPSANRIEVVTDVVTSCDCDSSTPAAGTGAGTAATPAPARAADSKASDGMPMPFGMDPVHAAALASAAARSPAAADILVHATPSGAARGASNARATPSQAGSLVGSQRVVVQGSSTPSGLPRASHGVMFTGGAGRVGGAAGVVAAMVVSVLVGGVMVL